METTRQADDPALGMRTTLWSVLLAVHAIVLAAVFVAVLAGRLAASDLVMAIACLALAGVILTLFLLASALAQVDDARPPAQYGLALWWARHRLRISHGAEFGAIVAFLACGACLLAAVVLGNAVHVAHAPPLRAPVPAPVPVNPGVVVQGQALATWTWYIAAIGIPIIVAILVWIAWRQFQIARNKQKLKLFDRRMQVYTTVGEALGTIARQGNLTTEQKFAYLQGTRAARWLFAPEVAHYVDETLWQKITDLELHSAMSRDPAAPERARHIEERAETFKWMLQQQGEFDVLVARYLTVTP